MRTRLLYSLFFICFAFSLKIDAQNVGDTFEIDDIEYSITSLSTPNEVSITGKLSTDSTISIPSTVSNSVEIYNVTAIINFQNFSFPLLEVTIPNSVV